MTDIVLQRIEQLLLGDASVLRPREIQLLSFLLAPEPDDLHAAAIARWSVRDYCVRYAVVQMSDGSPVAVLADGRTVNFEDRDSENSHEVTRIPLLVFDRSSGIDIGPASVQFEVDWTTERTAGLAAKPKDRRWTKSGTFAGAGYDASLHMGTKVVLNVDFYIKPSTGPIAAAILRLFDEEGRCINEDFDEHWQCMSQRPISPVTSLPPSGDLRDLVTTLDDGTPPNSVNVPFDVTAYGHAAVAELTLVPDVGRAMHMLQCPAAVVEADGALSGSQKLKSLNEAVGLVISIAQRNDAVCHVVGLDGVQRTVSRMQRMARSRVDVQEEASLKFTEVLSQARFNPLASRDATEATRYGRRVVQHLTFDWLRKKDSLWGATLFQDAVGDAGPDKLEPRTDLECRLIELLINTTLKDRSEVRNAFLTFCGEVAPRRNNAADLLWAREIEQIAIADSAAQLGIKRSEAAPRVSRFLKDLRTIIARSD